MSSDFDPSIIEGKFSEPVVLAEHRLVLGLMHMDGAGMRVCTWDGEVTRHMGAAAARRLAKVLAEGEEAEPLRPVSDALDRLAERIDAIAARLVAERAQKFAQMPVEGNA